VRIFSVEGPYTRLLESGVSELVDRIRQDAWRRENGHEPLFPDFMLHPNETLTGFVVVGGATDSLAEGVGRALDQARPRRARRRA
jgi:hypothetical protein